jgi:pimeloyl-ACP methyl ester carboxylesterase
VWLLAACGSSCEVDGPLDYTDSDNWLCRPGLERACPRVVPTKTYAASGQVTDGEIRRADAPGLACFLVYPTLDLRLGAGLHDRTDKVDGPENWARIYGGPLQEQCDVYVPVYRQVRLGTYLRTPNDKTAECFEAAYADVLDAFEQFLIDEPERPFVLLGHSQGAQHVSRLVDERIEEDDGLLSRMVAAYPLGWGVATDAGGRTGGSFDRVEPCASASQTGCVVAFRTFMPDGDRPGAGDYVEGPEAVCTNPASPDAPASRARMKALALDVDHSLLPKNKDVAEGTLLLWPGAFDGRCDGQGADVGLEMTWARADEPPIKLSHRSLTKGNGAHIMDLPFGIEDVRQDILRRAEGLGG